VAPTRKAKEGILLDRNGHPLQWPHQQNTFSSSRFRGYRTQRNFSGWVATILAVIALPFLILGGFLLVSGVVASVLILGLVFRPLFRIARNF